MSSPSYELVRIVRQRIDKMVSIQTEHGFAAREAGLLRVTKIKLGGITLDKGSTTPSVSREPKCTVTVELTIDEGMCNVNGVAHGGFIAWLADLCSSMPLGAIWSHDRWDHSWGVSTNINTHYLRPAPNGATVLVTSSLLQLGKKTATMQYEVRDKESGKLLAYGVHVKADASASKPPGGEVAAGARSKL